MHAAVEIHGDRSLPPGFRHPHASELKAQTDLVHRRRWSDLSPATRRFIIAGAAIDGALKSIALVDLARRPSSQVRGSKKAWALAIAFVNSGGILPIVYLIRARGSGL